MQCFCVFQPVRARDEHVTSLLVSERAVFQSEGHGVDWVQLWGMCWDRREICRGKSNSSDIAPLVLVCNSVKLEKNCNVISKISPQINQSSVAERRLSSNIYLLRMLLGHI